MGAVAICFWGRGRVALCPCYFKIDMSQYTITTEVQSPNWHLTDARISNLDTLTL
jgi:hypothetical protein